MTTTLTLTLPLTTLPPATLSSLAVDYNSGKTQLQSLLAASGSPWQALLPTETGDTIVSLISTVHASAQQNIIRSFQDAFPNTAVADSAIYAAATMQGVRLDRKLPASLQVTISNSSSSAVSIPPYTSFSGANTYWFNNAQGGSLMVPANSSITATLYQGVVKTVQVQGLGSNSQLFATPEVGFTVSDNDTNVYITNTSGTVQLPRYTNGLWSNNPAAVVGSNPTTLGYMDRTLPNGALVVEFGDGTYGYSPQVSDTVSITYVVTSGSSANSINALNKAIVVNGYPTLSAVATANPLSGSDQTSALLYKNIAAYSYGTFGSAVSASQYQVTAANYPGIEQAVCFAERQVQGSDLRWMNLVQVTVLANPAYSSTQQLEPVIQAPAYIRHLERSTNFTTRFYLVDPIPVTVNIVANIYCFTWASLTTAQTNAMAAVNNLFSGPLLNYDIMNTDITGAIKGSYSGIDYVDMITPTGDLIVSSRQLHQPTISVSPTGGSIDATENAGVLTYAVGYTTATETVYPTNPALSTLITGSTNEATITWGSASAAISYQLYGRGAAGWGIIYNGPNRSFVDNGSVSIPATTPSTTLQRKTVQYNSYVQNSATLNAYYSERSVAA